MKTSKELRGEMVHWLAGLWFLGGLLDAVLSYKDEVTVGQLMRDNEQRLKDVRTVLAAIDLLMDEGKIRREVSRGHKHYLDRIRICHARQ